MKITSLKIAQLKDFVESEEYKRLDIKPITPDRAISQSKNPSALPEDIALIYAEENDHLLGFIGLLPFKAHGDRFFSNSCWWSSASNLNRNVSMFLFYSAIRASGNRFVVVDGTSHTKKVLEATNFFVFADNNLGFRGFSRIYLNDLFRSKYPSLASFSCLIRPFDFLGNILLRLFSTIAFHPIFDFEDVSTQDPRLAHLIQDHSEEMFFDRQLDDFNWIMSNCWLVNNCASQLNYPFSYKVEDFYLKFVLVKGNGTLIGAILVSVRNGHLRIPYFYLEREVDPKKMASAIEQFVRFENYRSVTVFNSSLASNLKKAKRLFFMKKEIERVTCFSKEMEGYYKSHPIFQDGDGDAVFTG